MNSGFYIAGSGLLVEQQRVDLISNNLANLRTQGFRARRLFSTVYQGAGRLTARGQMPNRSVAAAGTYEIPGPGPMLPTGRALDVFLKDDGVLALETPAGRRYTRNGALSVSSEGALVDALGNRVMGSSGPIEGLSAGAHIEGDGRVFEGEFEVGRLLVLRDPGRILEPEGQGRLTARGRDAGLETIEEPDVVPQNLEGSGTDALGELVELIQAQRAFESYQKLVTTTMNDVNRRAVNDIAG